MNRCMAGIFMILIGMTLAVGCETGAGRGIERDGKVYGVTKGAFRHRWWNYYERGLSFSEGQFYREALADLYQALKDREQDQRMARTYGMHFIDYFPHREIGVIHYLMGNPDAAKQELEISLDQFPTAKARFYLDRVRKAILEKSASRAEPPNLRLEPDAEEIRTRDDIIWISGIAEDHHFVSSVTINRKPLYMEGSQNRFSFKEKLTLSQGSHEVEVEAKNLLGGAVRRRLLFHVDREGPLITVEDIQEQGGRLRLRAYVHDDSGVAEVFLNHRKLAISPGKEIFLDEFFSQDRQPPELSAADRLGNQTSALLNFRSSDRSGSGLSADLASDWRRLAASDVQAPRIRLSDVTDRLTVYVEKMYIAGQVSDDSNIESLTVNQLPILRRKGQSVFFNALIELDPGENIVAIEAKDEFGNTAKKEITLNREIPLALKWSERLTVSVLPFDLKGEVPKASLAYQDNLIAALFERERFNIVEREKLDAILQEQKLSGSDLADKSTALRLGKLAAAQSVIAGSIIETHTGIEIVGRMIDTETSEILAAKDVYDEVKDLPALKLLAEGMSIKLAMEFPLVEGFVLQTKDRDIFTDLGEGKTALKRRLIVFREEQVVHPITGKKMGSNHIIIGKALVSQVSPDMSKAELIQGKPEDIKAMDKVIPE